MSLFTRTARAPLEYSKSLWMRGWVIMVMLFLYIPLFVLMAFSLTTANAMLSGAGSPPNITAKRGRMTSCGTR